MRIDKNYIKHAPLADLVNLNDDELARLDKKEYQELNKRFRKAASRRLNSVKKTFYVSYAAEEYFGGQELPDLPPKNASRQKLQHSAISLKEFLKAETSTLKGIKNVLKREEARIFGVEQKDGTYKKVNKDLGFKTENERKRFWSAYMEFFNQHPEEMIGARDSTRLQQFLGRESWWRWREFTADDISALVNKMRGEEE